MLNLRRGVVGVVAVLLVSGLASAQTTDIAALANAGDATAQNRLGDAYHFGQGMPQDSAQAVAWYRKAAEQGYDDAQNSLGYMYLTGQGVSQDYTEAVRWFRLAAAGLRTNILNQGHAAAQFHLGLMYATELGVPQDYTEAVRWYRLAADQGHELAQHNLGVMYGNGQGVPQDYVEAHKWANLAATYATGDNRKRFVALRDSLAKQMTPAQLAEAQRLAR